MKEFTYDELPTEAAKANARDWYREHRSAKYYHECTILVYRSYYEVLHALRPWFKIRFWGEGGYYYATADNLHYHSGPKLAGWLNHHLFDTFYKPKWYFTLRKRSFQNVERNASCLKQPWNALTGYTCDQEFERPFLRVMQGTDRKSSLRDLMDKIDAVLMKHIQCALDDAYSDDGVAGRLMYPTEQYDGYDEGQEFFFFDKDGNHIGYD